jgi:cathepsin B
MLRRNKKGGMDEGTKYTIAIGGFVVVMLVVVLYMVLNPKESILNRQVNDVNEFMVHNNLNQYFKQGENEQFEGFTIREAQKFFNIGISDTPNLSSCPAPKEPVGIPPSYDYRTDADRKACVGTPRQTGNCTAGHVLSVVSAVEDRICIANGATERLNLSAQDAVSCDTTNYYCDGGYVKNTLDYGTTYGFVTEECFPWKGDNTTCPAEPNK